MPYLPPPLAEPPRLVQPTVAVRESWLAGERADCERYGASTEVLDKALADFGTFVRALTQGHPRQAAAFPTPFR